MTNPWWLSLLAAGIGAGSALLGGWMTHLFTTRRDQQQFERMTARQDAEWRRQREVKLQDLRGQLYIDAMEYLENSARNLADAFNEETEPRPDLIPDVVHESRLNARIELYADEDIQQGWRAVQASSESIRQAFGKVSNLAAIHRAIQDAQETVRELRQLLRNEVVGG